MKKILYVIGALLFIKGIYFSFVEVVDRNLFLNRYPLLPQAVLTKEKKYIEEKLDKLGYDYTVVSTADRNQDPGQNGYGILDIKIFKGKCSIVEEKILNENDPNIHIEAFPQPPCREVNK